MIKMKILFCIFLGLFVITACQKQSAPSIEEQEVKRAEDMERLKACTEVNFNHGVLLYQNALLLFKCTRWDTEFPFMYQAIKDMSADSWNQLIGPLNESFLENVDRKNKFFRSIRELDNNGGLDDLSYVLAALNESNFFDAIRSMFLCMQDSTAVECNGRLDRIPPRKSVKKILHVFDLSPELVEGGVLTLKALSAGVSPYQEQLRTEVNKFKTLPLVFTTKIKFIDQLFLKLQGGLSNADRELLSNILMTSKSGSDIPWLYSWLHDEKLGREKFRDLIEYPILVNPEIVSEVRGLKAAYDSNFACSIYKDGNSNPNDLIQFDFKTHMADYVSVVKDRNYKSFYDFTSNDIVGLKLSTVVCKELEQNRYNVNFIKLLADMSGFLSEKKNYDLFKFLVTKTYTVQDPNANFSQNLYLFDMISGDIFNETTNANREILKVTREFYPVLFDILQTVPSETYLIAGDVTKEFFKKENDGITKGLSDYWLFLRPEEKNFGFNFIDRHFDKDVKYVMLLNFYLKILDDYRDLRPIFQKAWISNENQEEVTMLSIEDFVKHMSGKDALNDFKKFFSRNQIIRVLEVLSSGQQIAKAAHEELSYRDSTNYIVQSRSEKYKLIIPYDPKHDEAYEPGTLVECMKRFSELKNGLYDLVRNFPSACQKVTSENIAFRMFGWMNEIETSYLQYKSSENKSLSLFDQQGLLGPYMLNSQIGFLKIIDTTVGPYRSHENKNGIEYLLRSANYHLNSKSLAPLAEKNIIMVNQWLNILPEKNILYRNSLVKSFTKSDNFNYAKTFFSHLALVLEDYGTWIKSGQWKKASERSLGTYDANFDCKTVVNQHVAPSPCPTKEEIKFLGNDLLNLLSNIWEETEGSPIASLVQGLKSGEGIDIPLDAPQTTKYRLSLNEILRYHYDGADKTLKVNNQKVKYVDSKGVEYNDSLTVLERIETVIREVRFRNNYLGVAYLNHIVAGSDYNKDVQDRKDILAKCIKIPGARCGKKMSDDDIRMTYNALATYDGLLDVNNGRDLDDRFHFGNLLKAFQQTLVGSSAKDAQAVKFFPLGDDVLVKHNGKILADLTLLTAFTNTGRFLKDRIGRKRSDFEAFLRRPDFKRVDRTWMYGFDLKESSVSAEKLLKKIQSQHLLDEGVDWLASLDYNQLRLVEDTGARIAVLASYLGTPELVFEKKGYENLNERYKRNNISQMFLVLEKIIDYWPNIKKYFPSDSKLIDLIKPINTTLYFLTENLNSNLDPEKNNTYLALNDIFLVFQNIMFDEQADPRILGNNPTTTKGVDILLGLLGTPDKIDLTYKTLRDDYRYLDIVYQPESEWFLALSQNINRLTMEPKLELTPIRDYLNFSTKNAVCLVSEKVCDKNYHFDEPAALLNYLQLKNENGISHFMIVNKKLMLENIDQVIQMATDIFPAVKIKEIHPPLLL